MKTEKKSPVIELLDLVRAKSNMAAGHSWERLNHAMRNALSLAIGAGFKFAPGDVEYVMGNYNSGYWIGESPEWVYSMAVTVGNMSAVTSYETWKGRGPFIADDVEPSERSSPYLHGVHARASERLHVGARFTWAGHERVKVNSFSDDGKHVNAALYEKGDGGYESKVVKRFRISREDIIIDRAARKERKLTAKELVEVGKSHGRRECAPERGRRRHE